jgi:hypothetical protein
VDGTGLELASPVSKGPVMLNDRQPPAGMPNRSWAVVAVLLGIALLLYLLDIDPIGFFREPRFMYE